MSCCNYVIIKDDTIENEEIEKRIKSLLVAGNPSMKYFYFDDMKYGSYVKVGSEIDPDDKEKAKINSDEVIFHFKNNECEYTPILLAEIVLTIASSIKCSKEAKLSFKTEYDDEYNSCLLKDMNRYIANAIAEIIATEMGKFDLFPPSSSL